MVSSRVVEMSPKRVVVQRENGERSGRWHLTQCVDCEPNTFDGERHGYIGADGVGFEPLEAEPPEFERRADPSAYPSIGPWARPGLDVGASGSEQILVFYAD